MHWLLLIHEPGSIRYLISKCSEDLCNGELFIVDVNKAESRLTSRTNWLYYYNAIMLLLLIVTLSTYFVNIYSNKNVYLISLILLILFIRPCERRYQEEREIYTIWYVSFYFTMRYEIIETKVRINSLEISSWTLCAVKRNWSTTSTRNTPQLISGIYTLHSMYYVAGAFAWGITCEAMVGMDGWIRVIYGYVWKHETCAMWTY